MSSRKNGTGRGGVMAICMALQERRPFDLKEGNMTKEDRGPMEDSKKFEELYNEEFDEIVRYVTECSPTATRLRMLRRRPSMNSTESGRNW
ncbi:MAG: hypothetical protein ACLVLH_00790 [Eisenbergiella massiliensis]